MESSNQFAHLPVNVCSTSSFNGHDILITIFLGIYVVGDNAICNLRRG